jgi:putative phage-type endonuclease
MSAAAYQILEDLEQGSPEWHALRKTKITATDSTAIMGVSHWKTKRQLYFEKLSNDAPKPPTERMQRGSDLEPIARDLFCSRTGHKMLPKVVLKDWAMASLDGINDCNEILEVKCPGEKDHAIALSGKVPDHYYPQLQHQMYVCDAERAFYFSFDGFDGVTVEVKRDDKYIEKMLVEEKKFYDCLINKTPPEIEEGEYTESEDPLWRYWADQLRSSEEIIKQATKDNEKAREELIFLSQGQNTRGYGVSLCQVKRKGNIDYSKIPELNDVNLELFRKPEITTWRITCQQ